jgi:hypothetical protein
MATNTYVALDTQTLGSTAGSVTFSSIPQSYTDLILVFAGTVGTLDNDNITFNGDTGSNYSVTRLLGSGSSDSSSRGSNLSAIQCGEIATSQSTDIIQIQNYSNTTTYKTLIHRSGNTSQFLKASVGLWRNTAAITSITITNGGTFSIGSTFTLYGLANSDILEPKATGGVIVNDGTYTYHTFGASGTFTPKQSLTADVLVVAGGGGGGTGAGGGGGAGGLLTFTAQSLTATGYTVTVGAGGAGGVQGGTAVASNGANSQFGALTATVGGGGGGSRGSAQNQQGATGGSGGGSASIGSTPFGVQTNFTAGQGFGGGQGRYVGGNSGSGGGGGAGAVGFNNDSIMASVPTSGAGGIGATSALLNDMGAATSTGQLSSGNYYYAGGGGAGNFDNSPGAVGGLGGGGQGGQKSTLVAIAGTAYTGGGGGGGTVDSPSYTARAGATGGSGIVIVRYLTA